MTTIGSFLERYKDEHIHITKAVPLEHVPALTAEADETIVFDDVEGYPGFRVVDNLFCNRKTQSRVLGCAPSEVVKTLVEVLEKGPRPLKVVDGGSCQQRVIQGDDVDLGKLPIVRHTDQDPYPYTTSFAVHRDPETGEYNQMYPRCGVLGRNEMVASFVTPTAMRILNKHRSSGTRMPQALVIGVHPGWELAGCYSYPHEGWWEFELFEAITGEVGVVTKCKTIDLVVPAEASIVIEGYVNPDRTAQDGPSPGPTMLFTPYATQQPVFEVTAITMSNDPVYRNHQMTPFTDHQEMPRLFHEAIIYRRLRAMGLEVHDVHFPQGGGSLSVIIQVAPTMDGQVTDALMAVMGSPWLNTKMVIALDPDINIYDYRDVHYALATRVDPSKHVITVDGARGFPFDPTAEPVIGAFPHTPDSRFPCLVGKWGIDATKPVPYHSKRRRDYERAWPLGWGDVKLKDYL